MRGQINELTKPNTFQGTFCNKPYQQANTKTVPKFKEPYALPTYLKHLKIYTWYIFKKWCALSYNPSLFIPCLSILAPIHIPQSFIYHNLFSELNHSTDFAINLFSYLYVSLPKTKLKPLKSLSLSLPKFWKAPLLISISSLSTKY